MPYVVLACRVVLVGVLGIALLSKVRGRAAFAEFASAVGALAGLRPGWTRSAAYGVVAAEVVSVLLLVLPRTTVLGFAYAAALLSVFTVGIASAMRRGERTACRCFGASTTPLGLPHVVRNLILLAVACAGAVGAGLFSAGPLHAAGVAVAVACAAVAVLLVLRMDDIVAVFAPVDPRSASVDGKPHA